MEGVVAAFYYDASDQLEVAKFPEDFADWLRDEGREDDANEFMVRWEHIESITPDYRITLELATRLAEEYAPVTDIASEVNPAAKTYAEAFRLLRDLEMADEPDSSDEPLPWDREAAAIQQALADMPVPVQYEDEDEQEHEYPEVIVYVAEDDTLPRLIANTVLTLAAEGYPEGARSFSKEMLTLTQAPCTNWELFELVWAYVDVVEDHSIANFRNW